MEKDVTRSIEEQLSAFLDGELPEEELQLLVRRLEREQGYRQTLARYAAIGSVLRKEQVQVTSDEMQQRLMIVMQGESIPDQKPVERSNAGSFGARRGMLAAAVALLAVVGIYSSGMFAPDQAGVGEPQVARLADVRLEGGVELSSRTSVPSRSEAFASREAAINPQRLTSYLVSHGEYSRAFQGTIVDSRIVVQQASFEQ